MRTTRRRFRFALGLCAALGCSGGDDDDQSGPMSAGAGSEPFTVGGSTPPPPRGGSSAEACESFVPVQRMPFTACGGEPFGTWRLTAFRWETAELTVEGPSLTIGGPKQTKACPVNVIATETPEMVLELRDGGSGRMYETVVNTTTEHSETCANAFGELCEERGCQSKCGACGCTCICSSGGGGYSDGDIDWQRTGAALTIKASFGGGPTYDYCVRGDELQLSEKNGPVVTLQRVFEVSNPVACAERTLEECNLGEDLDVGCHAGACVGDPACGDAAREQGCTNRQGCAWDASLCAGEPEAPCQLHQYGKVPGCDLVETAPRCMGTRTPCPDLDDQACSTALGCALGPGCTGGDVTCSGLSGACSLCANVEGCGDCADGGPGTCTGTSTCVDQTTERACGLVADYEMGSCTWVDSVCRGDSTPCEELSVDDCADAPGCKLE